MAAAPEHVYIHVRQLMDKAMPSGLSGRIGLVDDKSGGNLVAIQRDEHVGSIVDHLSGHEHCPHQRQRRRGDVTVAVT